MHLMRSNNFRNCFLLEWLYDLHTVNKERKRDVCSLTEVDGDSTDENSEEMSKMQRLSQKPVNPRRKVGRAMWINDYKLAATATMQTNTTLFIA